MKKRYLLVVPILVFFTGCQFIPFLSGGADGEVRLSVDLPYPDFSVEEVEYRIRPVDGGDAYSGTIPIDNTGSSASLVLSLPSGDYFGSISVYNPWTDEEAADFYVTSDERYFSIESGDITSLEFPELLSTNVVTIDVDADISSMTAAGVTPDFVGVWMSDELNNNYYHFHAAEVSSDIRSGSFPHVKPGTYEIRTLATNFSHPAWTDDEPWHSNLTAEWSEEVTVGTGGITYEPQLQYSLGFDFLDGTTTDFPENESDWFDADPRNGTVEFTDTTSSGALHMVPGPDPANNENDVAFYNLNTPLIADYMEIEFGIKLSSDGDAHINLLTDYSQVPGDRILLHMESDGIHLLSIVNGEDEIIADHTFDSINLSDGDYHTIRIGLKERTAMVWVDKAMTGSPDLSLAYSSGIPDEGGFTFEAHNEYWIDGISFTRDIDDSIPAP